MSKTILKSSCGVFTKLRGTRQVIHYTKKFFQNTFLEMEASEIAQMRSLRFAVQNGGLDSIRLDTPTFSLYFCGIAAKLLQRLPRGTPIIQFGARLAPELETLKFLKATGKLVLFPDQIHCFLESNFVGPYWEALHKSAEPEEFSSIARAEVSSDGEMTSSIHDSDLVLINALSALIEY